MLSIALDLADMEFRHLRGLPPVLADAGRLRIQGQKLSVQLPQGRLALASGRQFTLKDAQLVVPDVMPEPSIGEIAFTTSGTAGGAIELLEHEVFGSARITGAEASQIDGKVDGQLKLTLPLQEQTRLEDIRLDGKIKLTEVRSKGAFGSFDVSGGALAIGVTEKSLDAKGDVLFNGVPAKVSFQRIFGGQIDKQPPLRISATLDGTDRDTLGLSVNHMVQGDVPVLVTVQHETDGSPLVHLQADLGGTELVIENMAWHKPPGRPVVLHCDIAKGKEGRTELQNFKLIGEDIAIDGWLAIDAKNQLKAFYFPEFSVNVITRLDVQGKMRDDNVLEVKAKGTTYDGRAFFRSLFSAGQISERPMPAPKHRPGLDLTAEVDTMVGFTDTSLKNVRLSMKRRGDKIVQIAASGTLSGSNAPVNVELRPAQSGPRVLHATTSDAGAAFRLVGFYPSLRGGEANLEVNLDGQGHADKTGILVAKRFTLLGDPIVSDILQNSDDTGKGQGKTRVVRQQIEFDRMRLPFSVGYGQFVLGESYINGPLLGATIRGKVDFNRQIVALDGTYVPLYGLNSIPNNIPLLGEILSGGRRNEGLLGVPFSIQGPMGNPQVTVTAIAIFAPGFLRQIFELPAGAGQSVQPRAAPPATAPVQSQSSSSPALTGDRQATEPPEAGAPARNQASSATPQRTEQKRAPPRSKDGWSSQTTVKPENGS